MQKDTVLIERLRDELGKLRHIGGELVPIVRAERLSSDERIQLSEATALAAELTYLLRKLSSRIHYRQHR